MTARLTGKTVLLSGGARGMGSEHARAIVEEGGRVVIADVLDDLGHALADDLGDAASYIHLDVTRPEQWQRAVARTISTFGSLNVLVNNAGICNFGKLGAYTVEDWHAVLEIDLTGPFLGMSAAIEALKQFAPSSIINVSSTAGLQGSAELHGYTAAKWGLRGLTKSVAMEVGGDGVRVNSVHPGVIYTPMIAELDVSALGGGALGRGADPREVAQLIVYLASDESSFSTGAEFVVDGGITAGTKAFGPISQ
jgi:3alpha(or 20beta)-hydroxysteroid dehydrogenase